MRIISSALVTASLLGGVIFFGSEALQSAQSRAAPDAVVVGPARGSTIDVSAALPPLDLSGMKLWNWNAKWHPSGWANPNSPISWRPEYIYQSKNGDVIFKLDSHGAPQLQALNGTPANRIGIWETDVTLPELLDGMIVAPLWLYDPATRDEIDFELAGRGGLDVSMLVFVNGKQMRDTVRLFAGQNMSNRRLRFAISVNEDVGTVDMYVDGRRVHRWDRSKMNFFVSNALKPRIEMWAANPSDAGFVSWAGHWKDLAPGKSVAMVVHGYRYLPAPTLRSSSEKLGR